MKFVTLFSSLSKKDADIAGGKGASLGEMMNAGIPVPDGFVVLSSTFDDYIEQADLTAEIEAILESVDHKAIHTVDEASEKIQLLIKKTVMPKPIATEVLSSFKELESPFVAVRSSATAEDGADHAWAGQLDSYLNTTEDALLTRVQECWASLFTPRAIFYRFEKGLHDTHISVAVVVQKMVNSEVSGIAFSVHPVTEDRNQLIIEAGFGLGEAIVSGSITPDSYVVEKEPRRIIDINISTQERKLIRKEEGGNEWVTIPEPEASSQVLTENQITELAQIIIGIENHYGFPCDIEWAFEAGKFYIVQSRPITTLTRILNQTEDSNILVDKYLKELKDDPMYPFRGAFSPLVLVSWFELSPNKKLLQPFSLLIVNKGRDSFVVISETKYKEPGEKVFSIYIDKKLTIPELEATYSSSYEAINIIHERIISSEVASYSEQELIEVIKEVSDLFSLVIGRTLFMEVFDYDTILKICGTDYKRTLDTYWEKSSHPLFTSFDTRRKKEMLRIVSSYPKELGVLHALYIFTDYYAPKSKEDVLNELNHIESQALEVQENIEIAEKRIIEEQVAFENWLKSLDEKEIYITRYIQYIMEGRDVRKDPIAKAQVCIYLCARELAKRADIDEDNVLSIMAYEYMRGIKWLKENKENIRKRENGFMIFLPPDRNFETEYCDFEKITKKFLDENTSSPGSEKIIKGQTASPGKVTGRVRILLDVSSDTIFEEGDILITSMTRPEFVPYMKKAKGVVTNEGGVTCHAAIISRELGIPCVIGTKFATHFFNDGDIVEVDADNGIVRVLTPKN